MGTVYKCPSDRLRIIVLGYIVRGPLGGLTWHHLQYIMGLMRIGHDVYYVEDSDDYPSCYDPTRHVTDTSPNYGLRFATKTFERVGLGERWVYYDAHTKLWLGPCADIILSILGTADLLLNISGVNPMRYWFEKIPKRALIDTDPVFTQIRNLTEPEGFAHSSLHTTFFSFGENINNRYCTVPNDGFLWRPTRQPVVLDAWPVTPGPSQGKFTTVMQWDSYPEHEYKGCYYGMKSKSFVDYIELPKAIGPIFELAVGNTSAPRTDLADKGWSIRDPLKVTSDPWTYQNYIQQSKAEFSVAKHGYVISRSGWFSERSAAYLACGRPVVVQDTGFASVIPIGEGILTFQSLDEAAVGIREVEGNYTLHTKAAREIAEEYFNSDKVLRLLVEDAMSINWKLSIKE